MNLSVTQFLHLENEIIAELLGGLNQFTCAWHVILTQEVLVVVLMIYYYYYPHPILPILPPSGSQLTLESAP